MKQHIKRTVAGLIASTAMISTMSFSAAAVPYSTVFDPDGGISMSDAAAEEIEEAYTEIQNNTYALYSSNVENGLSRDWAKYSSDMADDNLTENERVFYARLSSAAVQYISDASLDAKHSDSLNIDIFNGVQYSDILTKDEASKVYVWFQNNNPQYYFLNGYATSSKSIFPICYPAFVKGSDRAAETVKLFNTIDEYIEQITDDEVTVYESELSAHRLIVDSIEYKSNEYDQSLYSAVELKETVCQGYANLFTVLMNGIGVDTLTCYSPVHAWNAIYLEPVFDPDGLSAEWFGVDCTWDDSYGSCAFFNCGDANLKRKDGDSKDHTYEDKYAAFHPVLSSHDYNPYADKECSVGFDLSIADSQPVGLTVKLTGDDDVYAYDAELYKNDELVRTQRVSIVTGQYTFMPSNTPGLTFDEGDTFMVKCKNIYVDDNKAYEGKEVDSKHCLIHYDSFLSVDAKFSSDCTATVSWTDSSSDSDGYLVELIPYGSTGQTLSKKVGKVSSAVFDVEPDLQYDISVMPISKTHLYTKHYITSTSYVSRRIREWALTDSSVVFRDGKAYISFNSGIGPVDVSCYSVKLHRADDDSVAATAVAAVQNGSQIMCSTEFSVLSGVQYWFEIQPSSYWPYEVKTLKSSAYVWIDESAALDAPSDLKVTKKSTNTMTVSWTGMSDAVKYNIKICTDAQGSHKIGSLNTTKTSVNISNGSSDYYVFVRSVGNKNGRSVYSEWSSVKMVQSGSSDDSGSSKPSDSRFGTPTGLTAKKTRKTINTISWNAVSGASSYRIEIYADSLYSKKLATRKLTKTALRLSSSSSTTYYLRVCAIDSNGKTSGWATTVAVFG